MATIPVTKRGAEALRAELHKELKQQPAPWVINAIARRSPYADETEIQTPATRQGFIEGRLLKLTANCRPRRSLTRPRWMQVARWCSAPPLTWKTKTAAPK